MSPVHCSSRSLILPRLSLHWSNECSVFVAAVFCLLVINGCGKNEPSATKVSHGRQISTSSEGQRVRVGLTTRVDHGREDSRFFDFGRVPEGSELAHTFLVRNVGAKDFTIRRIAKSCSCESIDVVEGMVVPGGGSLQVTYTLSKHGFGERNGKVVISTDAEVPPLERIELTVHAEVEPALRALPSEIELFEANSFEQILRIESHVPGLLDCLGQVTTNRGNVLVTLKDQSPNAITFRVTVSAEAPWGTFYDLIHLPFDRREHPSLNVRVKAHRGHPLSVIPAVLRLPPIDDGETESRTVRIVSPAAASAFRITKIECPESIAVQHVPMEARHVVHVPIALHRPAAHFEGEQVVVFHTDPPGAATLRVRYSKR